jgi:hypothetical protein
MYLAGLSNEELMRYAERAAGWINEHGQNRIQAEFQRRGMGSVEPIMKAAMEALENQWRQNGCVKDASGNWTVPYDLMWRSLPRGEDR